MKEWFAQVRAIRILGRPALAHRCLTSWPLHSAPRTPSRAGPVLREFGSMPYAEPRTSSAPSTNSSFFCSCHALLSSCFCRDLDTRCAEQRGVLREFAMLDSWTSCVLTSLQQYLTGMMVKHDAQAEISVPCGSVVPPESSRKQFSILYRGIRI